MGIELKTAQVYTDFNQLKELHSEAKDSDIESIKQVAKQFEGVMMNMVMKSMREANKAFESDLFSHDQMDFYQDWFDQQLSLAVGEKGYGISDMLVEQLTQQQHITENFIAKTDEKPKTS